LQRPIGLLDRGDEDFRAGLEIALVPPICATIQHRRNGQSFGPTSRGHADRTGPYSTEQLEQMNREFRVAVERAFRWGDESEMAATATYDLRRR